MAVAEAGWASSKRKARSVLGAELHTPKIVLAGFADKVGSDFDNIGFADLRSKSWRRGGSPRVTSTASRKGRPAQDCSLRETSGARAL